MDQDVTLGPSTYDWPEPVQVGPFRLMFGIAQIHFDGNKMGLGGKEAGLLAFLLTKPGHFFTKQQIMHAVWPDWKSDNTHTVETAKYRVAEALRQQVPGVRIDSGNGSYAIVLSEDPTS